MLVSRARYGRTFRTPPFKERPRFAKLSFIRDHMRPVDNEVMPIGDARVESQYLDELTRKVGKLLQLKKQGSLLSFGGRHWKFGKLIAKQVDAKTLVYADSDQASLREAEEDEEDEILTIECDANDSDQITQLGKYDGVLMKEVLERANDVESLFAALYKILKISGRAIFIARLCPVLPLPSRIVDRWRTACPQIDVIESTAERHDFACEHQILKYKVTVRKSEWAEVLAERSLPFTSDLKENEIKDFLATMREETEFEDELHLIALVKED